MAVTVAAFSCFVDMIECFLAGSLLFCVYVCFAAADILQFCKKCLCNKRHTKLLKTADQLDFDLLVINAVESWALRNLQRSRVPLTSSTHTLFPKDLASRRRSLERQQLSRSCVCFCYLMRWMNVSSVVVLNGCGWFSDLIFFEWIVDVSWWVCP